MGPAPTLTPGAPESCPDVQRIDDNDNVATHVGASGVSCAAATDLVRAAIAAEGGPNQVDRIDVGDFTCTIDQTWDEASLTERTTCTAGDLQVTWQVAYGE